MPQTSESLEILYGVSFADANNGIIVGFAGEILTTTDGGSNWVIETHGTTQTLYGVSFIDGPQVPVSGLAGQFSERLMEEVIGLAKIAEQRIN